MVTDSAHRKYPELRLDYIPDTVVLGFGDELTSAGESILFENYNRYKWGCERDHGFLPPLPRLRHAPELAANQYQIVIRGQVADKARLRPGKLLALYPDEAELSPQHTAQLEEHGAEITVEPAFGLEGAWIDRDKREAVEARDFNTFAPQSVIMTHLNEVIGENREQFFSA